MPEHRAQGGLHHQIHFIMEEISMGDRSPKEKQKKKQQHDKEEQQKHQNKVENMNKHRANQPVAGQNDTKKAG